MDYHKVVLALAGGEDEAEVISTAVRFTAQLGAELSVLHVNDPHSGQPSMMMDAPPRIDEADIREQLRRAGHEDVAARVAVVITECESYSRKVSEISGEADLLIIGHSHRNRFLQALTETLDEEIANTSKCPVLIVPKQR